jgi:hypothetical protein
MNRSRRVFLATGALGTVALAAAGWLRVQPGERIGGSALDADGRAVLRAIVPALLVGALPADAALRAQSLDETIANVDAAIGGLSPAAQAELAELFALLGFAPTRVAFAGLTTHWPDATPLQVQSVLERWRTSRIALMRSAYDALHQLVLAAWYGNPRAWDAVGYPGPPALTSS